MERCNVTPTATLRKEVPWLEGSIWTACSRVAMRSVQDAVVPQQGHVPWVRQAKGRETRRVHQRVVADGGLATTGWKSLRGYCSPCEQAERVNPGSCTGSATAGPGKSNGDARRMHPHLGGRGAEGGAGDEAGSALGTEDGPSGGQISSCRQIWREGDAIAAEGPRQFRASTAGGDASPDRPGNAHAGCPAASEASSTSQREPGQIFGSFDRTKSKTCGARTQVNHQRT